MNPILESGINLIVWLQANLSWLRGPMQLLSFLGNEEFFLLLLPFVYWCVDVRLGARVGAILCFSSNLNGFFKLAFHTPRPYWVSSRVQAMSSATSYSLPSGHAQIATSVWGLVAVATLNRHRRQHAFPVVAICPIASGVAVLLDRDVHVASGQFAKMLLPALVLSWHQHESPIGGHAALEDGRERHQKPSPVAHSSWDDPAAA